MVLSAVGLTMWTRWESEYDAEAAYTVLTPKRRESAMLEGGGAIDDEPAPEESLAARALGLPVRGDACEFLGPLEGLEYGWPAPPARFISYW